MFKTVFTAVVKFVGAWILIMTIIAASVSLAYWLARYINWIWNLWA